MIEEVTNPYGDLIRRHALLLISFLAVAASISGITNGFALDDVPVVLENTRVHSISRLWELFGQTYWPPLHGSSLYRPLTMAVFALQWVIGAGSPLPFHVVNLCLYVLACLALYRMFSAIVSADVALLASALFAVHPVHTEVVANIVGQSELLVACFTFAAVERYLAARRAGRFNLRNISMLCGLYLAACLTKENAIVMPGLLAGAELLVVRERGSFGRRLREVLPLVLALLVVAIVFIAARTLVTGGLRSAGVNEILSGAPFTVRLWTMLGIVMEWIRLLFWPAQLSADYSFPRTRVATSFELAMVPGLLVLVCGAVLAWHVRREKPVVSFAAVWIAVTMIIPSNLILLTGFVLAERALFLPSVGIVLLVALAAQALWSLADLQNQRIRTALVGSFALILACAIWRSAVRNPVWRDNTTLFAQTVQDSPFSSRAHWMLAEHLAKTGDVKNGAEEILLAVVLGRKDDSVLLAFAADQLATSGMCRRAMPLYRRALELTPHDEQLRVNASLCLARLGHLGEARAIAVAGLEMRPASAKLGHMVVLADSLATVARERPQVR